MALVPLQPDADILPVDEDEVCTPEHCFHAFDTLYCALKGAEPVGPKFPDEKYALFVTWEIRSSKSSKHLRLRGCIGTFQAQPIRDGIAEYALISAFRDTRFNKIQEKELPLLECSISLLTNFEDCKSYLDWTVGIHGIQINFSHPSTTVLDSDSTAPSPLGTPWDTPTRSWSKRPYSACYLPEIASEQGWSKVETIDSAIRKAGWTGRITEDLRRSLKVQRYQSRKCAVSYEDYIKWRNENKQDEVEA